MNSLDREFLDDVASMKDRLLDASRKECLVWKVASRQKAQEIERMSNEIERLEETVAIQARQIQDLKAACAWKDERA